MLITRAIRVQIKSVSWRTPCFFSYLIRTPIRRQNPAHNCKYTQNKPKFKKKNCQTNVNDVELIILCIHKKSHLHKFKNISLNFLDTQMFQAMIAGGILTRISVAT